LPSILITNLFRDEYTEQMKQTRTYHPITREAARLLGARVRLARRERRWTVADLAERVGVSRATIQKVEHGDLTVAIGTVFEAAALVGVTLFDDDRSRRSSEMTRTADRLALMPRPTRLRLVDNDF
jgi:transcriptional regulator with XRE-family HTH domain